MGAQRQNWTEESAVADLAGCFVTVDEGHLQIHQDKLEGIPRLVSGKGQINSISAVGDPDNLNPRRVS